MNTVKLFGIIIILIFVHILNETNAICHQKSTCSECIQEFGCLWCLRPEHSYHPHCSTNETFLLSNTSELWCKKENIYLPEVHQIIVDNKPLSNRQGKLVQLRPQELQIRMRRGQEHQIQFEFKHVKNQPIDLYILFDCSYSTKTYHSLITQFINDIIVSTKKMSYNIRIGYGTFIDYGPKTPKYSSSSSSNGKRTSFNTMVRTLFKNYMPLTTFGNINSILESVSKRSYSTETMDDSRSTFDIILQIAVCRNEIGWRDSSQRFLIVVTDGKVPMKISGDGKLTGNLRPNEGECSINSGKYTRTNSLDQVDFPSLGLLNQVLDENRIHTIFVYSAKNLDSTNKSTLYSNLEKRIKNLITVRLNRKNAPIIVDVIRQEHIKVFNSIVITSNNTRDVNISISPKCDYPIENGCSNLTLDEIVHFGVKIIVNRCESSSHLTKTILAIGPVNSDEKLIIHLSTECGCSCEFILPSALESAEENLENSNGIGTSNVSIAGSIRRLFNVNVGKCSGKGVLQCGKCYCLPGNMGEQCQCDSHLNTGYDSCLDPAGIQCSGLGSCECGKCRCKQSHNLQERIYGEHCECDNFSCKRTMGELCSGNGDCDCGRCRCTQGWSGETCNCADDTQSCIAHNSTEICTGRGECQCGQCVCSVAAAQEHRFGGEFCEECVTCSKNRCAEIEDCIQCFAMKLDERKNKSDIVDTCQVECQNPDVLLNGGSAFSKEIVEFEDEEKGLCNIASKSSKECFYTFHYLKHHDIFNVTIDLELHCPFGPKTGFIVSAVIIGTLLLGLIPLAFWKIFVTCHDKWEYWKFEKEKDKVEWIECENPVYAEPNICIPN